ncbi:MAG: hypothetical protein PHP50_03850 [Lachnospiraceae bacterium]|nr:hypothetical protein [Lachnospiraceae bacterium]
MELEIVPEKIILFEKNKIRYCNLKQSALFYSGSWFSKATQLNKNTRTKMFQKVIFGAFFLLYSIQKGYFYIAKMLLQCYNEADNC